MTTANKITITRILLIPCFVLAAVYYGQSVQLGAPREWIRYTAIAIFIIASVSDGIDGYIARRFNQKSQLGAVLDPIADKGLLLTTIITLTFSGWNYSLPLWFLVLVIARDIVIVIGFLVMHYFNGNVKVDVSMLGKCATATQMVAISWVMLQLPHLIFPVAIAGFLTFVSGVGYVIDGMHHLHLKGHGEGK